VAQCVKAGLVAGTKIHADSILVDANASLNSVRELNAGTLAQIQRVCREHTETATKQTPRLTRRMKESVTFKRGSFARFCG
jgi:hypothetical protein